jgi:hypothetical protein
MPRGFNYARGRNNAAPRVQSVAYQTGQVFKAGAVLILSAAGEVLEAGADPAAVYGIALQGAGTGMGYDLPNSSVTTVVTGRAQEVSILIANSTDEYYGRGVNGGTDPVIPLQTHIGEQYGIAKVGNDWVIDLAEVTVKQVEITDIVPGDAGAAGFFIFKFLKAAQVAA